MFLAHRVIEPMEKQVMKLFVRHIRRQEDMRSDMQKI